MSNSSHTPVMVSEVLGWLKPATDKNYIDATVGGGGHAEELLRLTKPRGILLGFDRDHGAVRLAEQKLHQYRSRVYLFQKKYSEVKQIIKNDELFNTINFSGALLDLGLSLDQLRFTGRGFTFLKDEPLDMRFDSSSEKTAELIINKSSLATLIKIFKDYGEERQAVPIARQIVVARKLEPINRTKQLTEIIDGVYKKKLKTKSRQPWIGGRHPATKIFQALRIAVNDELGELDGGLKSLTSIMGVGSRLVVISYHSLEDRIVKKYFKAESKDCICPPSLPKCVCDHEARLKILTKKPQIPKQEEINKNPASRSAKLRCAEII
ncbi:16S rRNA (cytosine(1402)-N(4))-methyltransferase RsmH [Patescibacteria group bacterium]